MNDNKNMDSSIINPFLKTTITTFVQMFNITPTLGKPFLAKKEMKHKWEISGIVGVVGDIEGVLVIRVTKDFATKLIVESGMTFDNDEEKEIITTGVITEIVNVISGNALPLLNAAVIDITPPVVIQGLNHTISWPSTSPIIGVPFNTTIGDFEIQISISN